MRTTLLRLWLPAIVALCPGAALAAGKVGIVVIGATAASAPEIITQALAAGHSVTAFARRPDAIKITDPRLKIVKGDVTDTASIAAALTGKEVVVSVIGPRVDPRVEIKEMDLYSVGTTNIVAAMKQKGNRRLIVTSSVGAEEVATAPPPEPTPDGVKAKDADLNKAWLWNARKLYSDMQSMEKIVAKSGLQYVILHPGFVVNQPARHNLKTIVGEPTPKGRIITYADFATFALQAVTDTKFNGKTVGLYSDDKMEWGKNLDFNALLKEREELAGGKK